MWAIKKDQLLWSKGYLACRFFDILSPVLSRLPYLNCILAALPKENKQEGRSEVLLGPDNNIEFLRHFMNILLKRFWHDKFAICNKNLAKNSE